MYIYIRSSENSLSIGWMYIYLHLPQQSTIPWIVKYADPMGHFIQTPFERERVLNRKIMASQATPQEIAISVFFGGAWLNHWFSFNQSRLLDVCF